MPVRTSFANNERIRRIKENERENNSEKRTDAVQGNGRHDAHAARSQRAADRVLRPARRVHHGAAPQAPPVLQSAKQHTIKRSLLDCHLARFVDYLSTEPHVLSHTEHLAETGKLPSIHWCGMAMFYHSKCTVM